MSATRFGPVPIQHPLTGEEGYEGVVVVGACLDAVLALSPGGPWDEWTRAGPPTQDHHGVWVVSYYRRADP